MLDVAITNSLTLFRCCPLTSKSVTTKMFHELLAKELVGDYCSKRRPGRGPSQAPPSLSLQHFPKPNREAQSVKDVHRDTSALTLPGAALSVASGSAIKGQTKCVHAQCCPVCGCFFCMCVTSFGMWHLCVHYVYVCVMLSFGMRTYTVLSCMWRLCVHYVYVCYASLGMHKCTVYLS